MIDADARSSAPTEIETIPAHGATIEERTCVGCLTDFQPRFRSNNLCPGCVEKIEHHDIDRTYWESGVIPLLAEQAAGD